MPRKPRQLVDGGYYHLIARGNNRLFLFALPEGFVHFTHLLGQAKTKLSSPGACAPPRQQRYRDFVTLEGPYDGLVDDALVEAHF